MLWCTSFYKNANINITGFENKGAGPGNFQNKRGIPNQHYELHCPNIQILWLPRKVNQGLKSQTPPYLPNGDSVSKFFYIIGFRTLENGGVGHLQISKKKLQWGQNAHQTQKPQISYILQTSHF